MQTDENIRSGMAPEEAAHRARLSFGTMDPIREDYRDHLSVPIFENVRRDFSYAFRVLLRNPAFALVTVLSLGVGIGANTSIFSVLNAVTLRSLSVKAPDKLFQILREGPGVSNLRFSYPQFEEFERTMSGVGDIAAMSRVARPSLRLDGAGEAEFANLQLVSGGYFHTLGIEAQLGRLLGPQDNVSIGGHPVAVISDSFWRRRLSGMADVIGKQFSLNGTNFTVVGVAPRNFDGVWLELPTEVWVPLVMQTDVRYAQNFSANHADLRRPWMAQENIWWLDVIVRPEVFSTTASALDLRFRQMILDVAGNVSDPAQRQRFLQQRLALAPFGRGLSLLRQRFSSPLSMLMAMVALLLLIACANTANLLSWRLRYWRSSLDRAPACPHGGHPELIP